MINDVMKNKNKDKKGENEIEEKSQIFVIF